VPAGDYALIGSGTAIILGLMVVAASVNRRDADHVRIRLVLIERKLDTVLDHLAVEVPEPHLQQTTPCCGDQGLPRGQRGGPPGGQGGS
jgi:hypothetical protein